MNLYKQFFVTFFGVFFLRTVILYLEKNEPFYKITGILVGMLLINLIYYLSRNTFYEWYKPKCDAKLNEKLSYLIYEKYRKLDYAYFDNPENTDIYYRILENKNMILGKVIGQICNVIGVCFALILLSTYIVITDATLILLAIIPILGVYYLNLKMEKISFEKKQKDTPFVRKQDYSTRIFYLKEYAEDLKLTHIGVVIKRIFHEGTIGLTENTKVYGFKLAMIAFLKDSLIDVGIVITTLIYVVYKILVTKSLIISDYIGISQAILYLSFTFNGLFSGISQLRGSSLLIEELQIFLEKEITDSDLQVNISNKVIHLKMSDINFQSGNKCILKDITFEVKTGEKIAIVGRNGAGKTTLVNLLLGLYKPTSGLISLNEVDIQQYNLESYQNLFSVIQQNYQLYAFSVEENIRMGEDKEHLRMPIREAIEKSGLASRLDSTDSTDSNQESTVSKEFNSNGLEFSGGDAQKIAIARLLVNKKSVLILDEPSSALDPIVEMNTFKTVFNTFIDDTIIFISHRLSSTKFADTIYFLENGQIIESGTHEQLMELSGSYSKLYQMQAEKYNISKSQTKFGGVSCV
jgi:ATP-binding cassette subfamily B protein